MSATTGVIAVIVAAIRNIGVTLLSRTIGIWVAKLAAKSTKTMVDDNAVLLLEGGLNNDPQQIERAAKDIIEEIASKAGIRPEDEKI